MARINTDEGKGIETAKHAKYAKRSLAGWQVLAGAGWSVCWVEVFFGRSLTFSALKIPPKNYCTTPWPCVYSALRSSIRFEVFPSER